MRGPKQAKFTAPWTCLGPSLSARSPTLTKSKRPAEKAFSSTAFKGYLCASDDREWVVPLALRRARTSHDGPNIDNLIAPGHIVAVVVVGAVVENGTEYLHAIAQLRLAVGIL